MIITKTQPTKKHSPLYSLVARVMEPDCLTCHVDFQPPETDTAFNIWTEDEAGLFHNRIRFILLTTGMAK